MIIIHTNTFENGRLLQDVDAKYQIIKHFASSIAAELEGVNEKIRNNYQWC